MTQLHPDNRYIQALLHNERSGVQEIYARFASRIERFICANSGSPADACDIFQEALIAICRQAARPGFELRCPFEAYLLLVCKGKWFNELKRRKSSTVTIDASAGFTDTELADALADSTLLEEARDQLFRRFFEQLSEKCRQIIRLSWSGLSMEEVSNQLNITYGFARKRKSECITQLMTWIRSSPDFEAIK